MPTRVIRTTFKRGYGLIGPDRIEVGFPGQPYQPISTPFNTQAVHTQIATAYACQHIPPGHHFASLQTLPDGKHWTHTVRYEPGEAQP